MLSLKFKRVITAVSTAALAFSGVAPLVHAAAHPVGSFVKTSDGTVWMISPEGTRRPFTSAGAALSYGFFSWSQVMDATAEDAALPVGSFINPRDGSIFCATESKGSDVKGECSLITGGMKAAFTSASVFSGLGFSFSNAFYGDSSFLTKTTNIASATEAHRPGVLVNNGGTVQYVGTNGLLGIPDIATFNSWGFRFVDVVPANAADKAMTQTGVISARQPGQLSPMGTTGGTTPPPSTAGSVMVSGGSMTPSTTLPKGANSVKVGDFVFTAPSTGSVTISGLTVKRVGVGVTSDISNAYIYDGNMRLTSGRTFNSSTNEATFSLNVVIPANSTKTLSLVVSFSSTATTGAVHQFQLAASSSVNATGASVNGSFPIMSNSHTISGTAAGTLTIEKNGSISNPRVGDRGVKVSEFKLSASTEDAYVSRVTLSQGGNIANTGIMNLMLKQAGTTVATASSIDSQSRLALVFSTPFLIERGNNRVFELYADVDGRPADTISFYVEEVGDVQATGGTYGAGMTTSLNANFDQSSDTGLTLTLQGGTFTVTFTGPSSRNISNTSNDVSLWEGTVYSANAVEVRNWRVNVTDTNATNPDLCDVGACAVQDIKIWNADTNQVLAGPKEFTEGADENGEVFVMADTVNLAAGSTTKIKITADVRNNPTGNIAIVAFLNAFQSNDIKNQSSNTYLTPSTDISPNANITGQTQTVTAGALTVSTAPSPTDQTVVKGVQSAELTAFNFAAGSGDTIKINSVVITAGASDTNDNAYGASGAADGSSASVNDMVLSAKLMDGTTQVGQSKSFSSGTATFDNLNWSVPASQTKKLSLVVNTNSAATLNSSTDYLRFSIESSGVTAVDSQGNTVSATGLAVNSAEGAGDVVVSVTDNGSLTATLAAEPTNPSSALIASGSSDRVLAAFKFEATQDSFLVKKFVLLPYVGGSNSAASNDRIGQLKVRYDNQAGQQVVQTVGLSGTSNNVDISANPMYVPQNGTATLEVLADVATFSLMDGSEAENITFALKGTDSTNNQATGLGSNSDVSGGVFNASDLVGNRHNVYRTILSVAKGATTSSNTARATSQNVASVQLTSSSATNALFRGAKRGVDGATTGWTANGMDAAATTSTAVSGSTAVVMTEAAASAVNDSTNYDFGASAGLQNYNRLNFNIRTSVAKAAGDIGVSVSSTADATDNATLDGLGTVTVNNVNIGATTANTWLNVDIAGPFVSTDRYVTFNIKANADNAATIIIDDLRFYNDSMNLDIAGSLNSTTTTSNGTRFDLKTSGGTIKAYGPLSGATASSGTVLLIPGDGSTDVTSITTTSDIEVTSTAQTLDIITNTINIMATDTTANETLSVSWDTGTVSSAGDFRWYDNSDTAGSNNIAGITVVSPTSSTQTFTHNY